MKMSYKDFQERVLAIIDKAGGGILVWFDSDGSKHLANCSDGTTITGNSGSAKATVKWGSGHQAMAVL